MTMQLVDEASAEREVAATSPAETHASGPSLIKREERRQASAIHGGAFGFCAAALGVRLSRLPIPSKRLRQGIYRTVFGKKYAALDESECERPLSEYRSFNALFTRGVKAERRPFPKSAETFIAPCDSRVQDLGRIEESTILTVKGIEYTLDSLLPEIETAPFRNGKYAILFLSPSDCHRIFCPQTAVLREVRHVPGYRLLVHPPYQRKEYPVFALNERVIMRFSSAYGAFLLVLVAGWGTGHITLPIDPSFRPRSKQTTGIEYGSPIELERGQWIATFELGSTAILITEEAAGETHVERDEKLNYGQPLCTLRRG